MAKTVGNLAAVLSVDASKFSAGMKLAEKQLQVVGERFKSLRGSALDNAYRGQERQVAAVKAQMEQTQLKTAGRGNEAELAGIRARFDAQIATARSAGKVELAIAYENAKKVELIAAGVAQRKIAEERRVHEFASRLATARAARERMNDRFSSARAAGLAAGAAFGRKQGYGIGQDVENLGTIVSGGLAGKAAGGGMLNTALKVGGILMAVNAMLKGSVVLAKVFSGEIKDWGEAASGLARAIPVIGEGLSQVFDYGRGKDLKEEAKQRADEERRNRAQIGKQNAELARDLGREASDAEGQARVFGMRGVNKELARIELERQQAVQAIQDRISGTGSGKVAQAGGRRIAAENAKFDAQRAEALRDQERTQREQLVSIDAEIQGKRLAMQYRGEEARTLAIQADYAEKIRRAQYEGNNALARQLGILRDMTLEEAKQQEADRRKGQVRDVDAEIFSAGLRLSGRKQEAALFEISKDLEDRANEARRDGNLKLANRLELLKQLKTEELLRGGSGGMVQGSPSLTATGPRVSGGRFDWQAANSTFGQLAGAVRVQGYERQTALLEQIAEAVSWGTPARAG